MKKCKTCNTYGATLMAEKDQPAMYATIAPQSDSDAADRFIYIHSLTETEQCYYCAKKSANRIGSLVTYSHAYDGR